MMLGYPRFYNEFVIAVQTNDAERIHRLITNNSDTTEHVQQRLMELGEGNDINASQSRMLAEKLRKFRLGDFSSITLARLLQEGLEGFYASEYNLALEKWQEGLSIARNIGDKRFISQFLDNISMVYSKLGQYQKALKSYQQALVIAREIGDKPMEGKVLTISGMIYAELGQYSQALNFYKQALEVKRSIDDKPGIEELETEIEDIRGEQFFDEFITALQVKDEARIKQLIKDNPNIAKQVYHDLTFSGKENLKQYRALAEILREYLSEHLFNELLTAIQTDDIEHIQKLITNNSNVVEYLQKRLKLVDKDSEEEAKLYQVLAEELERFLLGDFSFILDSLQQKGEDAFHISNYHIALEKWQTGLKQACILNEKRYSAQFIINIGNVYSLREQYQQALDYYQQALSIFHEVGDKKAEINALSNISVVYETLHQHQHQQVLVYYQKVLAIHREIVDRYGEGRTLNKIGNLYQSLGQYQQSLEYYEQALSIARQLSDKNEEIDNLGNIGLVCLKLHQYKNALKYLQQALRITDEINDKRIKSSLYSPIAGVYNNLGQYQDALKYYQQALNIARNFSNKREESINLGNIGVLYRKLAQYQEALEYFQQALTIHHEKGDKFGEAGSLTNIGNVYTNLGKYQQALEYHLKALRMVA